MPEETTTAETAAPAAEAKTEAAPKRASLDATLKRFKDENLTIEQLSAAADEAVAALTNDQRKIKDVIVPGILRGDSTDEIVAAVHAAFPETAKTGPKDVAFYRSRLRVDFGIPVPSARTKTASSEPVGDGEASEGEKPKKEKRTAGKAGRAPRAESLKEQAAGAGAE